MVHVIEMLLPTFLTRSEIAYAMCPEVDSASENEYQGFLLG